MTVTPNSVLPPSNLEEARQNIFDILSTTVLHLLEQRFDESPEARLATTRNLEIAREMLSSLQVTRVRG